MINIESHLRKIASRKRYILTTSPTFSRDNAEDIKVAVITIAFISLYSRSGSAREITAAVETLIRAKE